MRRPDFIAGLGGVAWRVVARTQQPSGCVAWARSCRPITEPSLPTCFVPVETMHVNRIMRGAKRTNRRLISA
jgi:hypothetical protein